MIQATSQVVYGITLTQSPTNPQCLRGKIGYNDISVVLRADGSYAGALFPYATEAKPNPDPSWTPFSSNQIEDVVRWLFEEDSRRLYSGEYQ